MLACIVVAVDVVAGAVGVVVAGAVVAGAAGVVVGDAVVDAGAVVAVADVDVAAVPAAGSVVVGKVVAAAPLGDVWVVVTKLLVGYGMSLDFVVTVFDSVSSAVSALLADSVR